MNFAVLAPQLHAYVAGPGVFAHVRQRLLGSAEKRNLYVGRQALVS